ncbi:MAG: hypothetical protein KAJ03_08445 [Gammaproteobacteria bacterium]|nr:hypothetical protein [Gammaproteobacteria bacterium]
MKLFSVIFVLALVSSNLYAEISEETNKNIDRACLKQAITLVNQLKSDIYIDMDSTQSNKILKLATATCRQQFGQADAGQSFATAESAEEAKSDDWFTDYILHGEVANKKGNKRLKRLK